VAQQQQAAASRPSAALLAARHKRKERLLLIVASLVGFLALCASYLFPKLRISISLFTVSAILIYLRAKYFAVPGVSAMPFSRFSRLVQQSAAPPR